MLRKDFCNLYSSIICFGCVLVGCGRAALVIMWLIRSFLPSLSDCPAFLVVPSVLRIVQVRTSSYSNPSIRLVAPRETPAKPQQSLHTAPNCSHPFPDAFYCRMTQSDGRKKEWRHSSAPPSLSGSTPPPPWWWPSFHGCCSHCQPEHGFSPQASLGPPASPPGPPATFLL